MPKFAKDGWGCEQLAVPSKDHSEYDIWSHSFDLPFKAVTVSIRAVSLVGHS